MALLEAANADADKSVESADSAAGSGSAATDNATDSHTGPNNPMDAMAGGFHDQASGNKLADDVERGENSGTMQVGGVGGVVSNPRVSSPGNRADLFNSFDSTERIPLIYRSDPRFESLASDPAHANKVSVGSRREAMAGLEAESVGLIKGKIQRGPAEIEFYDGNGAPFDVKTPPSAVDDRRDFFNAKKTGRSILRQLDKEYPNKATGTPESINVILDSTYLNQANHKALWDYLNNNATPEQLKRIIEVNVKL